MDNLLNVSASPHVRSPLSTRRVMLDVIISLLPSALFGIWHFGVHTFFIILCAVGAAVLSEFVFCKLTKRPVTVGDFSAALTGLLLALVLSPTVPLYIPIVGSVFAILIVKCFFGGLGQNFMNPALAARCFLLISFGAPMTNFAIDGMSSATPLVILAEGGTVNLFDMFFGLTTGTIAISIAAMLLGAVYLFIRKIITWQIPVAYVGSFLIMMTLLGGHGLDPMYLLLQVCGGGVIFGAVFMATDPVTSPVTGIGHLIYGAFLGILTALFRIFGSYAESVSYAIIIGNLFTPLIDRYVIEKPFAERKHPSFNLKKISKAAVVLTAITLVAGAALGGVNTLTKDRIEQQRIAANQASYAAVLPAAEEFVQNEAGTKYVQEHAKETYGEGKFGKVVINEVLDGLKAGEHQGYVLSVTTKDGFEEPITMSVGVLDTGEVTGVVFTEIAETPGMGMECDKEEWRNQFVGVTTDQFVLNKSGGSTQDYEIDTVSGASTTSGAIVNAVNAALDFINQQLK